MRRPAVLGRARLHRRIFFWFGATIVATVCATGMLLMGIGSGEAGAWRRDAQRVATFTGGRFARVWNEPNDRSELAEALARDLDVDVRLTDAGGGTLAQFGAFSCGRKAWHLPIRKSGALLGYTDICAERHHMYALGPRVTLAVIVAGLLLWGAAGAIARRISRPIAEVARVAEEIGGGNFKSRVVTSPRRRPYGEVTALASAINTMAARIEKQFRDQRELLATVSHEIRTPLSRIRLLLELTRESGADDPGLAEIDREIVEMDALVAELLANSRVDFGALTPKLLEGADAARRALERAGIDASALVVSATGGANANATRNSAETEVMADATLLARALANLIDNAQSHGGGLSSFRVEARGDAVAFMAEDRGPGLSPGEEERIFEPFYRGDSADREHSSLGLGLALVRRIAEAHHGRAVAHARKGGGASIGIELPRPGGATRT